MTSRGSLSSRTPRYVGCRMPPPAVHSLKRTSTTSPGSTHRAVFGGAPTANGEVVRSSDVNRSSSRAISACESPLPTRPA